MRQLWEIGNMNCCQFPTHFLLLYQRLVLLIACMQTAIWNLVILTGKITLKETRGDKNLIISILCVVLEYFCSCSSDCFISFESPMWQVLQMTLATNKYPCRKWQLLERGEIKHKQEWKKKMNPTAWNYVHQKSFPMSRQTLISSLDTDLHRLTSSSSNGLHT